MFKYWKRKDSNRVIAVSEIVQMCSCWIEISKEEFDVLVQLRGKNGS